METNTLTFSIIDSKHANTEFYFKARDTQTIGVVLKAFVSRTGTLFDGLMYGEKMIYDNTTTLKDLGLQNNDILIAY